MTTSQKIQVTDLDFDTVKTNLKQFLSGQSQFQDFDFEGSGINILLDVMAYNTLYNGFYANMAANEMYLDTAQVRNSVVSHAKAVGYCPKSKTSSRADLHLVFAPNDNPTRITIPAGTKFTAGNGNSVYTFQTLQPYYADETADYEVDVQVVEGKTYAYQFTVNLSDPEQRFIIPNANIDTSTLSVSVQQSPTNTTTYVYTRADDVTNLSPTSLVYYLQEAEDGKFELVFGDGVLGTALVDNNVINISYILTNGELANKLKNFSLVGTISGYTPTITIATSSYGGSDNESIDAIKFTAPKHYEAQNRYVTAQDYETLLPQKYPYIEQLKVWGGQDNVPPIYGKVFISIKPAQGLILSESAKQVIQKDILAKQNIVAIIPEIIDPSYTYLTANVTVHFDERQTNVSAATIEQRVRDAIQTFANTTISKYGKQLKYSQLVRAIDQADPSIVNNLTDIRFYNVLDLALNVNTKYIYNFNNAIVPSTINSEAFTYTNTANDTSTFYAEDDGNGILLAYKLVSNVKVYAQTGPIGVVNYTTGTVEFTSITFNSPSSATLRVNATPVKYDVEAVRNQILLLDDDNVTVTVIRES